MTDTGNVAEVPLGMHSPKKGEQIGPGVEADEDENMEEVLEAVVNDLAKLEETLVTRKVEVVNRKLVQGDLAPDTAAGAHAEYDEKELPELAAAKNRERERDLADSAAKKALEASKARIAARRAAAAPAAPEPTGLLSKLKGIFSKNESQETSFISELDEAIFNKVSGYIKDTISKAQTGLNHRDAHGDTPDVGNWGVLVGPNDGPRHPSMARKKDPEEIVADPVSPKTASVPVVENTKVNGFRGVFKEGMQVSGDHRNRARRKLAAWMGV